jgi:hypothetical protein
MAGRGPVPKDPAARRNRTPSARGEWVDLPPLERPVLPELAPSASARGRRWSPRTVAAWNAWRQDPATGQFGPAEIAAAVELAYVMEAHVRGEEKAAEVRLRMDGLGLTPKGKRDLRWRVAEKPAEPERPKLAELRRLRAVDPGP